MTRAGIPVCKETSYGRQCLYSAVIGGVEHVIRRCGAASCARVRDLRERRDAGIIKYDGSHVNSHIVETYEQVVIVVHNLGVKVIGNSSVGIGYSPGCNQNMA